MWVRLSQEIIGKQKHDRFNPVAYLVFAVAIAATASFQRVLGFRGYSNPVETPTTFLQFLDAFLPRFLLVFLATFLPLFGFKIIIGLFHLTFKRCTNCFKGRLSLGWSCSCGGKYEPAQNWVWTHDGG